MQKSDLKPCDITKVLSNNIKDKTSIFVFPTDVVMNSWTDWIITHPEESGTTAVADECFMAWDNFKSSFVSANQEEKTVIPSVLRKLYVSDLISRNSQLSKEKRFQVIINPNYAKEAASFTDWLCDTLRSLHFWKTRLDENVPEELRDEEDLEYCKLYDDYSDFLNKNNLFEPSWVEDIEFTEREKSFHIFYPELLEDFSDYINIFDKVPNINIYTIPEEKESGNIEVKRPYAFHYSDSRKELRQTMLSIIKIVTSSKDGTDWSDVALSIPDIETYRPYIEREFDLYGIPYVIKAGVSLTNNGAGRIFREIQDCYNSRFSYESVRTLLLDEYMPWKEEINIKKEALIREGSKMRCICSITSDIWLKAFNKKIEYLTKDGSMEDISYYESLKEFYQLFREKISCFFPQHAESNTFENILTSWMSFKAAFFDEENFSEDANNILSRCIVELHEIINIEKEYRDCKLTISSPYNFFLQELDSKLYTKQTDKTGVNIFPYKLSAAAYFKYQFVIDSSQKNLDISYKRLTYLSNKKREALKLTDDDSLNNPSDVFIKLYGKTTEAADENFVHFSAAENSFSGFAIPHSSLEILDKKENPDYDNDDYILQEKELIRTAYADADIRLLESQKASYENWKKTSIRSDSNSYKTNNNIDSSISSILKSDNRKIKISARGALEKFFPCPRKWMFSSVLKVEEDSLDTNLMNNYDMGNLNHKIMELFMKKHQDKKLPYFDKDKNMFLIQDQTKINTYINYSDAINKLFYGEDNIVTKAIENPHTSDYVESPLAIEALLSQRKKIADKIVDFLKILLLPYGEGTFSQPRYTNINGIGNCTVVGVEKELFYELDNFNYFGRIDCYLQNDDKQWIILDYKNTKSSIPAPDDIHVNEYGILGDFQMPVYYQLISNNKDYKQKEICAGYFYAIKTGDKAKATDIKYAEAMTSSAQAKDAAPEPDLDFNDTITALDEYGQMFTDTVHDKDFYPYYTKDKSDRKNVINYKNCKGCPYKTICRTTYTIAGKTLQEK